VSDPKARSTPRLALGLISSISIRTRSWAALSNTVKNRYEWRYNRASALESALRNGIAGLVALVRE